MQSDRLLENLTISDVHETKVVTLIVGNLERVRNALLISDHLAWGCGFRHRLGPAQIPIGSHARSLFVGRGKRSHRKGQ
jgi:hypothetical protein